MIPFTPFPKIARFKRNCVVTEKIDGTNAQIFIVQSLVPEEGAIDYMSIGTDKASQGILSMFAGSRTRWITPASDNFGFAKWVLHNSVELFKLGPGHHYGEWWGSGIQRGYGLVNGDKRFSLFNTGRWRKPYEAFLAGHEVENFPRCCHVVPVLAEYTIDTGVINAAITKLAAEGSVAAPGFMQPEGVVVFHTASGTPYKITLENDGIPKSLVTP